MTAAELLDALESRALLPGEVLATLRQQVSRSIKIVTPESVAKLLVGKGLITAFQAEQLLASAKPAATDLDDEMSLAPLDDEKPSRAVPAAKPAPAKPAAVSAVAKTAPGMPAAAKLAPAKPPATKPSSAQPSQAVPTAKLATAGVSAPPRAVPKPKPAGASSAPARPAKVADPLGPLGTPGPLDDLLGDPLAGNSPAGSLLGDPLLGDPLGDPLGDALLTQAAAPARAGALRPGSRRKKSIPTWVWFAVSGAVGVLGIIIAIVILTRSNGDPEWRLAEKDFQAAQDQDATQKLNAFLEAFPQHRQASLARVYLGMARLRQAFAAKADWDGQLTAARQVLPELVREPDFPQVRETLAKMLPDMAAGLAQQAQAFHGPLDQRAQKAEQAREGLALAEDWRFVPDKLKPWASLQATSDQVAEVSREIDRGLAVEKALAGIRAAIASGSGADAFGIRDKLLQAYPELRQGEELDPVVQELVHAVPQLVKIDSQQRAADTKPRATPIIASFTDVPCAAFADASAGRKPVDLPAADPKSPSIAILANGAVYWLEANNGAPLGRQFVGLDSVAPVAIPAAKDAGASDWVVFDSAHQELVCYGNGGTELRWRQSTGDTIDAAPVLVNRRLYVATRGGRLAKIDADSGKWLAAAQFPEPLRAAPGISPDLRTLYVAGDHGTLYFVKASDLHCAAAVYLGYGSGSVRLPPTALGAYVVIVANPDWDTSELRAVSMPTADAPPRAVQKISLAGQVASAPVAVGRQLMLATDRGTIVAFDASGSGAFPLIKSMQTQATAGPRQPWYVAIGRKQLWLAGNGLAHRDLGALSGAMRIAADQFVGTNVTQSPIIDGDRVIVSLRRGENSGVWITAVNAAGRPEWQAVVASPAVGDPTLDAERAVLRLVHPPAAKLVEFPISTPANRVVAAKLEIPPPNRGDGNAESHRESAGSRYSHCAGAVLFPGGMLAAAFENSSASDDRGSHLFFSTANKPAFRASPWSDSVCSPPVVLGNLLLIANPVGQICLVDVASGQSQAAAFQPRLVPGEQLAWRKPAIVPGKFEAIISDGGTHLYRLGLDETPSAHLTALAEATVAQPVVSDVAIAGDLAFIADDADYLTALNVADLKAAKGWRLGGHFAWGPRRVGDLALIATDRELLAIGKQPDIVWRVPLDAGVPVGLPLESGNDILLATANGIIERLDRKTGNSKAKIDLEQPLAAGPIVCGKNLAVVGQDGTVHIVAQP